MFQRLRAGNSSSESSPRVTRGRGNLEFGLDSLKALYTELLLFHEIGHHLDQYCRRWTKANRKQVEDFADQYAYERTAIRARVYSPEDSEEGHFQP